MDLITVAQALHWFDFDAFYSEAKRVLKPSGVIAVWTYGLHQISNDVDPISERFYKDIVGEFWPPERRFVEEGYSSIPFPFDELSVPGFEMSVNWDFHQYIGYLETWSATKRYESLKGRSPIQDIYGELSDAWGTAEKQRKLNWRLSMRAGRHGT